MKRIKIKIVMLLVAALLFTTTLSTIAWAKNIDTEIHGEDDVEVELLLYESPLMLQNEPLKATPTGAQYEVILTSVLSKMKTDYIDPEVGSDDWEVFDLYRGGAYVLQDEFAVKYYNKVKDYIDTNGIENMSASECARLTLALTAAGWDAGSLGLLNRFHDLDWLKTDLNGAIYAAFAIESNMKYRTEYGTEADTLLEYIAELQGQDGSWDPWGFGVDLDTTAMACQLLSTNSKYSDNVASSMQFILSRRNDDGDFDGGWGSSVATNAQVLLALLYSSKNPYPSSGEWFLDQDRTPLDTVCKYYDSGEFFDKYGNKIPTQQGEYSLIAYDRYKHNKRKLYDMKDISISTPDEIESKKNYSVSLRGVTSGSGSGYSNPNAELEAKVCIDSSIAVAGDWVKNPETGKWTLFVDGQMIKGSWAAAKNSYAGNKAAWFLFDNNGDMLTGWQQYTGADRITRWYYLNPVSNRWLGACYLNTTTPDGYQVDSDGAWIEPAYDADVTGDDIVTDAEIENDSFDDKKNESAEKEDNKITVNVSIDGSLGDANGKHLFTADGEVEVKKNASAYDALKAFAKKKGWTVNGSSSYISGINGLKEKSNGALSGWIYSVNGEIPGKSIGSYKLSDGDSVELVFVEAPVF